MVCTVLVFIRDRGRLTLMSVVCF